MDDLEPCITRHTLRTLRPSSYLWPFSVFEFLSPDDRRFLADLQFPVPLLATKTERETLERIYRGPRQMSFANEKILSHLIAVRLLASLRPAGLDDPRKPGRSREACWTLGGPEAEHADVIVRALWSFLRGGASNQGVPYQTCTTPGCINPWHRSLATDADGNHIHAPSGAS